MLCLVPAASAGQQSRWQWTPLGPQRGHWAVAEPLAFTDQWLSHNAILLHLYKGVIISPFFQLQSESQHKGRTGMPNSGGKGDQVVWFPFPFFSNPMLSSKGSQLPNTYHSPTEG